MSDNSVDDCFMIKKKNFFIVNNKLIISVFFKLPLFSCWATVQIALYSNKYNILLLRKQCIG